MCDTKHDRFTLNLHGLKKMIVESFPSNFNCPVCCSVSEMSKTVSQKYLLSFSVRRKLINGLTDLRDSPENIAL